MRLVHSTCMRGDPGPQGALRYASVNGRQLFALAGAWPELASWRITGSYHAVGRERIAITEAAFDIVTTRGFDALRPASMIFEHMSLGPPAQLAIALGCKGPFYSFEGDVLAGAMALQQALEDLEEGRCEQALVMSYDFAAPAAWLMLLAPGGSLAWQVRHTFGVERPDGAMLAALAEAVGGPVALLPEPDPRQDPHGLEALGAALEAASAGQPVAVWLQVPDGRGILAGFGPDRAGTEAGATHPEAGA